MKLKQLKKYLKEKLDISKAAKEYAEQDIRKYALLLNELETIEDLR